MVNKDLYHGVTEPQFFAELFDGYVFGSETSYQDCLEFQDWSSGRSTGHGISTKKPRKVLHQKLKLKTSRGGFGMAGWYLRLTPPKTNEFVP